MSPTSKIFLAASLLVLVGGAFAEEHTAAPTEAQLAATKKRVCELPVPGFIREVKTNNVPSYFFKTHPENDWVCYISGGNHVLNMATGEDRRSPGGIDDMFTPDGKYYVIPRTFYRTEDALNNPSATPILSNLQGSSYQSVGIISSDETKTTYRYTDGSIFSDVEITHNPGGTPTINPNPPVFKPLCPNISKSLPMISKDGQFLAGVNYNEPNATTRIWKIEADGSCREVENLGISTGKVEFGYDNDWITFHVFSNDGSSGAFGQPSANTTANIYVYQRSTNKFHRITNNTKFSSVYPSFKKDGSLVYMNHYAGTSDKNTGFVHVAPPSIGERDLKKYAVNSATSAEQKKEYNIRLALGGLWKKECSPNFSYNGRMHTVLDAMGLGKTECQLLVKNFWNTANKESLASKFGPELKELTADDLLRECPTHELSTTGTKPADDPVVAPKPPKPERPKARAVPQECRDCHQTIPFDNLEELRTAISTHRGEKPMIEEILRLVRLPDSDPDKMPPEGPRLTAQQIAELERYLSGQGDAPKRATTPMATNAPVPSNAPAASSNPTPGTH